MAKDKISPEERLFKVIQEGKNAPLADKNLKASPLKRFFSNLNPSWREGVVRARSGIGIKQSIGSLSAAISIQLNELSPRAINKALIIMLGALIVMTIHFGINKRPSVARISEAISKIHFPAPQPEPIEAFKPVDFYLNQAAKRDIFRPPSKAQEKAAISKPRQALEKLKETARDLRLEGISWGSTPKVMIRNEKEDKMYFLREGQMIAATGIEIKAIFKNKVLISYQGEELELL